MKMNNSTLLLAVLLLNAAPSLFSTTDTSAGIRDRSTVFCFRAFLGSFGTLGYSILKNTYHKNRVASLDTTLKNLRSNRVLTGHSNLDSFKAANSFSGKSETQIRKEWRDQYETNFRNETAVEVAIQKHKKNIESSDKLTRIASWTSSLSLVGFLISKLTS